MKTYLVGGAVRDQLLGRPVVDRDWLVLDSSREELLGLGFTEVGNSFRVFLHPETHDQYSLPRERDGSLEGDLRARDLTVNAMAIDEAGLLHDPFGGVDDLKAGLLRHVGEAFSEDAVRILRAARFAAELGFEIAAETEALIKRLVGEGALAQVHPDRVWNELKRILESSAPNRGIAALGACGATDYLLWGTDASTADLSGPLHAERQESPLELSVSTTGSLSVRLALFLVGEVPPGHSQESFEGFFERCRAPLDLSRFIGWARSYGPLLRRLVDGAPAEVLEMILATTRRGRPEALGELLVVEERLAASQASAVPSATPELLALLVEAVGEASELAEGEADLPGHLVGERLRERQLAAVLEVLERERRRT
jgi:tRNA nucleotidyltransferase/poly(A) polymerase